MCDRLPKENVRVAAQDICNDINRNLVKITQTHVRDEKQIGNGHVE